MPPPFWLCQRRMIIIDIFPIIMFIYSKDCLIYYIIGFRVTICIVIVYLIIYIFFIWAIKGLWWCFNLFCSYIYIYIYKVIPTFWCFVFGSCFFLNTWTHFYFWINYNFHIMVYLHLHFSFCRFLSYISTSCLWGYDCLCILIYT